MRDMDKTAFDIGISDGIEKVSLSKGTLLNALEKRMAKGWPGRSQSFAMHRGARYGKALERAGASPGEAMMIAASGSHRRGKRILSNDEVRKLGLI